jgi:hypothetical protein
MFRYRFVDHAVPATCRRLAAARLTADCQSENTPTIRARRPDLAHPLERISFRSLRKLVVSDLDRIADVDNVGNCGPYKTLQLLARVIVTEHRLERRHFGLTLDRALTITVRTSEMGRRIVHTRFITSTLFQTTSFDS